MAAHGTHVYRQGKGFLRVVHPVVARDKHLGVLGLYMDELREAHVFNQRTLDAAVVVTHELGHAVDHALGHLRAGLRAGVGETAQATSTQAPSQQPSAYCSRSVIRSCPFTRPVNVKRRSFWAQSAT